MFFGKKSVDGVEMGSELAKLYGSHVPNAMFMVDNVASGFTLRAETYNPITMSRMNYPLFALIWVFAVSQVTFFSLKDGNAQKLASGMWQVLDMLCRRYLIDDRVRADVVNEVTQVIAKDAHFTTTGFLQDYDGNNNRPIMERKGLSYAIAHILRDRCLTKMGMDASQMQTAVSGIVRDFEYSFRAGANAYRQFKVR